MALGGFVLDGIIIAGNNADRLISVTSQQATPVIKKPSWAVVISILVHLFLAFLLFVFSDQQPITPVIVTNKAIKSYLYKVPVKPVKPITPIKETPKLKQDFITQTSAKDIFEQTSQTALISEQKKLENKQSKPSIHIAVPTNSPQTEQEKSSAQASFSAYQQLENLKHSINEKITADEFSQRQQFRSPSVMHGAQIPVPHSFQTLTPEQKREQNTTKMSDDISITKYDNGICTIEREQFLGSPVEGSSSAFACGESQFDKSFRQHMKKVQERLLPTNNQ